MPQPTATDALTPSSGPTLTGALTSPDALNVAPAGSAAPSGEPQGGTKVMWDDTTKLPTVVPEDTPESDVLKPIESQKAIKMVGTDNIHYDVPGSNLLKAISNGWRLASKSEQANDEQVQALLKPTEEHPFASSVLAGTQSFLNQALLEVPGIITRSGETEAEKQAREIFEERHPVAQAVGGTAGFLASLLYGGELEKIGQMAEKGVANVVDNKLASTILSKGANAAVVSGLYSTPAAIAQTFTGDPKQAAETIMWGLGAGGVLGATLGVGGMALGKIGNFINEKAPELTQSLKNKANELLAGQASISAADANKLGSSRVDNIVDLLDREGIKKKLTFDDLEELQKKYGKVMDNHINDLDALKDKLNAKIVEDAANPQAVGDARVANAKPERRDFTNFHDFLEERIKWNEANKDAKEAAREAATSPGGKIPTPEPPTPTPAPKKVGFDAAAVANNIQDEILQKHPFLATELMKGERKEVNDFLLTLAEQASKSEDGLISFRDSNKLKQFLGQKAKWDTSASNTMNAVRQSMYSIFSREQEKVAESLYKAGGTDYAGKFADYLAAKKDYGTVQDLYKYGPKEFEKSFGKFLDLGNPFFKNALGNVVGGTLLHPALGPLAYPTSIALNHAVKYWWNSRGGLNVTAKFMKRIADDPKSVPFLGSFMAMHGNEVLNKQLNTVPNKLANYAKTAALRSVLLADPYKTFLGDQANGLSKDQQYARVVNNITSVAANPDKLVNNIGHVTSLFSNDPALAQNVQSQYFKTIDYLNNNVPKNPNMPQPFDKTVWQPSKQQKQDFADKLEVIQNPMVVMDHINNGTLSKAHVESLQYNYPGVHSKLISKIAEAAYNPQMPKPNDQKLTKLSLLVGTPLGPSVKNVAAFQQLYTPEQKQMEQQKVKQNRPRKMNLGKLPDVGTNVQRLQYKI